MATSANTAPAIPVDRQFDFRDADFSRVRKMIHARAGISLGSHKREMVYSRLARRLRALGGQDFSSYLDSLENAPDAAEWEDFINALTTNLTAFFRESHHFPILADFAKKRGGPVSVWCCAASTGEEPYSIAITLTEALGPRAAGSTVLATDIDTNVLNKARSAVYPYERVAKMESDRLRRFSTVWAHNAAGIGTSVSLGLMLGLTPSVGAFFGIPLDVRHVTLSAGQLALATAALWPGGLDIWLAYALAGVACMFVLNLSVSFVLAFLNAVRAYDLPASDLLELWRRLSQRMVTRPGEFLLPARTPFKMPADNVQA